MRNTVYSELAKVKPIMANLRLVIALHSPHALLETGLRMDLQRKTWTLTHSILGSPFSEVRFVNE